MWNFTFQLLPSTKGSWIWNTLKMHPWPYDAPRPTMKGYIKDKHQPWCWVFTDKVIVTRLVMKFFGFMETESLFLCSQSQLMEPNLI
jgi:hypothetical protein